MEDRRICQDKFGLVKCTDDIFAPGVVNGHLAPHTAVYLGQERRGQLNQGHAPQVSSRHKAGHIPHHAAAQGQNGAAAVKSCGIGQIIKLFSCGQVLVFFTCSGNPRHNFETAAFQTGLDNAPVKLEHLGI